MKEVFEGQINGQKFSNLQEFIAAFSNIDAQVGYNVSFSATGTSELVDQKDHKKVSMKDLLIKFDIDQLNGDHNHDEELLQGLKRRIEESQRIIDNDPDASEIVDSDEFYDAVCDRIDVLRRMSNVHHSEYEKYVLKSKAEKNKKTAINMISEYYQNI